MVITVCSDAEELGMKAARLAAEKLKEALNLKKNARLILSTGSSQFETLSALLNEKIDWSRVVIFHLDEYVGLSSSHPASFRRYLNERFVGKINPAAFFSVDADGQVNDVIDNLTHELRKEPVDLGLIGIGVNGHIAFNDPPADFQTTEAYIEVSLDEVCRKQQVDEGWFASLEEVPPKALTMTPWQIMQCKTIISAVPHRVKATSVCNTLINPLTEIVPATILKQHQDFNLYIDRNSASEIFHF